MVNGLDVTLAALADPTRRRVVELLRTGARPARDVAEGAGVTRAAMSRHLRVLRAAGLVAVDTPDHDARERVYRLRPEHFVALGAWVDQLQAFWSEQLGAFKQHAERQAAANQSSENQSSAHQAAANQAAADQGREQR